MYPGFTDRQWPGFSPRTHPFGLAGTYVFIKQSGPPRHCDPRSRGSGASRPRAPLLPKLRGQFAEFPGPGYPPDAWGYSPRGTCVGSRYGRGGSLPVPFSWAPGVGGRAHTGPHSRLRPLLTITVLQGLHRLAGSHPFGCPRSAYPEASETGLALPRLPPRHGNINPFPLPRVRVTARVRAG